MINKLLLLLSTEQSDDSFSYPALESVLSYCAPFRHAQTILEAFSKPSMMHTLPILKKVKENLLVLASETAKNATHDPRHEHTQFSPQNASKTE